MATANVGSISTRSLSSIPLYTTTTNQFDKTVFTGKASPVTVILPSAATNSSANVSFNTSSGVFSLTSGITYQLITYGTISNYNSATPATVCWYNTTTGAAVGAPMPVGSTLITTYKPGSSHGVVVKVTAGSAPFDYPAQLDTNFRTVVQVVGGWTE